MDKAHNDKMSCCWKVAPRPRSNPLTTGKKHGVSLDWTRSIEQYDADRSKPPGSLSTDARPPKRTLSLKKKFRLGTWNVRSLNNGKLEILKSEMTRTRTEILGISELKWTGAGYFISDDFKIFYSGHEHHRKNGVAIILRKNITRSVMAYYPVNDRIISIRIKSHPVNLTIIQVYAPTTDAEEETIEEFYDVLQQTIDQTPKKDMMIVIGDLNAKVGDVSVLGTTGKFGLGKRNEAGQKLIEFCASNSMFIANTYFVQPKRRLYTWTSPNGVFKNQIDYIIGSTRWKSSLTTCKTLPGADCGSDHQLLITEIHIKLRKTNKERAPVRFKLDCIPGEFRTATGNRFSELELIDREPDELWHDIKTILSEEAKRILPLYKKRKTPWLSEDAIQIAQKRRIAKSLGKTEDVRDLNAKFQRQARKDKDAYFNLKCNQIEEDNKKGRTRALYKKIKEISRNFQPHHSIIKDKNGKDLCSDKEIVERWKEYTENLYVKTSQEDFNMDVDFAYEPQVTKDEVFWALKHLSNGKSPGYDDIPAELLKKADSFIVDALTVLCQQIWETTVWPNVWKQSIFIPLHKKGNRKDCSNYRTISLISHTSKILLKIIQKRLEPIMERELAIEQAWFQKK